MSELNYPDVATATTAVALLGLISPPVAGLDTAYPADQRAYIVDQAAPTGGQLADISFPTVGQSFANEIAAVFSALAEGQEPLGGEFESVWNDNLDKLYEF